MNSEQITKENEYIPTSSEDDTTPIDGEGLKQLEQLEEIGKEIDQLENKLQELPGAKPLDMTKFNRKQRRQMQRKMVHQGKEKQKTLEQKGSAFVTRKEFVGLFQSAQKLRDRLYYVDILTAAMEKLLIAKGIVTEEELADFIKKEAEKAQSFQEIQRGVKDYENRLKKCKELTINPNISIIPQQIYEDTELSLGEKQRLATEYDLKTLLKIFEDQTVLSGGVPSMAPSISSGV
jgi:hypothetical protein